MDKNEILTLKEWRLKLGYTLKEIGNLLEQTESSISQKENNKRKYTLEDVIKLRDFYGLKNDSIKEFFLD